MLNLNLKRKLLLSVGMALIGVTLLLSGFANRSLTVVISRYPD